MKKFLAIAAIAATFTACNDEKKAEGAEAPKTDSPKVEAPAAMDTAKAAMDTAKAAMDTAKAAMTAPKAEEKK